jgi:hypothetical protein
MHLFQGHGSTRSSWCASIVSPGILDLPRTPFCENYGPATNYPIVRIRNRKSGHVRYCRTTNHSIKTQNGTQLSIGVATKNTLITTQLAVPGDIELGPSDLFVVANGIPSAPMAVNILAPGRG